MQFVGTTDGVIPCPDTGSLYNDVIPVALSCHPSVKHWDPGILLSW
ncbi:MAG: hypothetical protein ACEY3L_15260 [Wolbachia sp.]